MTLQELHGHCEVVTRCAGANRSMGFLPKRPTACRLKSSYKSGHILQASLLQSDLNVSNPLGSSHVQCPRPPDLGRDLCLPMTCRWNIVGTGLLNLNYSQVIGIMLFFGDFSQLFWPGNSHFYTSWPFCCLAAWRICKVWCIWCIFTSCIRRIVPDGALRNVSPVRPNCWLGHIARTTDHQICLKKVEILHFCGADSWDFPDQVLTTSATLPKQGLWWRIIQERNQISIDVWSEQPWPKALDPRKKTVGFGSCSQLTWLSSGQKLRFHLHLNGWIIWMPLPQLQLLAALQVLNFSWS